MTAPSFPMLEPNLQISFYYRLQTIRDLQLGDALSKTVRTLALSQIDAELHNLVDAAALTQLASDKLRGEVVFPVPVVLRANPSLLGYYRLLLGFSQKEFYYKGPFGRMKTLEEVGTIPPRLKEAIRPLCTSLIGSAERLVHGLPGISREAVHELQLLTVGAQFRGSENTRIGQRATGDVRDLVKQTVEPYLEDSTERTILVRNDSNRIVLFEFSADPDVRVTEQLPSQVRPTLSIEIKGGGDASNIHNRLGEAEKSHLKARSRGFHEFWTIVGVDIDDASARRASPTTSEFFNLGRLLAAGTTDHDRFRQLLCSLVGIRLGR